MRVRRSAFLPILRIIGLFFVGLVVAVVVALSRVNLETLRGNLVAVLRDATGMPVEIDGAVSWKFSLRPRVELNQVRIPNAQWAKAKYAFSAERIDVRLNLVSLFRDRPTIQNVRVYDADINIEKNSEGMYSLQRLVKPVLPSDDSVQVPEKYPFREAGLGAIQVKNLRLNFLGDSYSVAGFNIRLMPTSVGREYSGWVKSGEDVLPFIVSLSEYNAVRKIYPVRIAISTGGDALIANVALEGKSKMPIDFIVRGEVLDAEKFGRLFNLGLSDVPPFSLNVVGGMDRKKITLRKSEIVVRGTKFVVSGDLDWGKKNLLSNLNVYSPRLDLSQLFPGLYGGIRVRKNRDLNVFKDIPLFADELIDRQVDLNIKIDDFIMYRDLNLSKLNLKIGANNNHVRIDIDTGFADGNVKIGIDANIEDNGHVWLQSAAYGEKIYVGEILDEINKRDLISELPMDLEFYVQANGKNLSEIMQTITGPVRVYSSGSGYAHSALVAYMYGTDFLTSLRHSIQDLFSSQKKHDQIKISCVALNVKLRDGVFETQNGFAIETNAINMRLAGSLNLGDEDMKLSLTTVPVRGLKLSLTGNVVNSVSLSGSLAQPDIKISGAAMAGKVASATGLGLLLAPFTGGISLVAGAGLGLVAGDLLENWLADSNPCETALESGAPDRRDDPEWLSQPISELMNIVFNN